MAKIICVACEQRYDPPMGSVDPSLVETIQAGSTRWLLPDCLHCGRRSVHLYAESEQEHDHIQSMLAAGRIHNMEVKSLVCGPPPPSLVAGG